MRKVAVLGTGVMGVQIAALLANAEIQVVLFGRPAHAADPSVNVRKTIEALRTLESSPLISPDRADYIDAANYAQDLSHLKDCDLIIESIVETIEAKEELLRMIAPWVPAQAIVATNTSGLSVNRLTHCLPETVRAQFCGIHFFNPPRLMHLVELVATKATPPELLDMLESWIVSRLGKGVIRAHDMPNFVANRVGFFSMLTVMHHAQAFGLGFDEADVLTGPIIGRAKSATFRTADIVGLDTTAHVIETMRCSLPNDPWWSVYTVPEWMSALIKQGALGQKTQGGVYRKEAKSIQVIDRVSQTYRESLGEIAAEVLAILGNKDPAERIIQLRACAHPQAQFLWAVFRDLFHYVAFHLADIADTARDVDFAMRWGFGWVQGPFETWQAAGWRRIAEAIRVDIKAGQALSLAPLPAWVLACDEVHSVAGSYSARATALKPRSALAVYQRQIFPPRVLGELAASGVTHWENGSVRLWSLPHIDHEIAIMSVMTRNHTLGREVIDGVQEALARAEANFKGVVFWQDAPFSYGANLKEMMEAANATQFDRVEKYIAEFQNTSMALKYARIPVVAAVQGMALGGGCEFMMHAAKRVIALESQIGLVETGAGLIPGGGGCKEFALRAWQCSEKMNSKDPIEYILPALRTLAGATVSRNGVHAKALGFVLDSDPVIFNTHEVLYVALREVRAMAEASYHPGLPPRRIKVAGRAGVVQCEAILAAQQQEGRISEYDFHVAQCVAIALCGGDVEVGTPVDEKWLLDLERRLFVDLLRQEKTRQRVRYLLENGRPLRN